MKSQSVLVVALVAFSCCALRPVTAAEMSTGIVVMTTTGGTNSITVDATIADNGAVPGCTWYVIKRDGAWVAYYPRQLGVQNILSFTDTNVVPNHTYWYELTVNWIQVPVPSPACDETQFRYAFGSSWGFPIDVPGHVGTDPIPVAHGKLGEGEEPGYAAHIEPCGGGEYNWFYFPLPSGYEGYVGQDVLLYGEWVGWNVQFGWGFQMTSLELFPCAPVATENTTWGRVKSMYR